MKIEIPVQVIEVVEVNVGDQILAHGVRGTLTALNADPQDGSLRIDVTWSDGSGSSENMYVTRDQLARWRKAVPPPVTEYHKWVQERNRQMERVRQLIADMREACATAPDALKGRIRKRISKYHKMMSHIQNGHVYPGL